MLECLFTDLFNLLVDKVGNNVHGIYSLIRSGRRNGNDLERAYLTKQYV